MTLIRLDNWLLLPCLDEIITWRSKNQIFVERIGAKAEYKAPAETMKEDGLKFF